MNQESWLRSYLRFTEKNEAPELFHFWVGVALLSTALGRKCFFDKGHYQLYPNFFIVLVAGSALCRKTTAIEIGAKLLLNNELVRVEEGKISTEKFVVDQAGRNGSKSCSTLIKADELSVFLTRDQQGDKLIDVLTKMFDCPDKFSYKTLSKGDLVIQEPYITILAGTQPSSLARVLPDSAFGGGFTSRIMFVYQADTTRLNALPKLSAEEKLLGESLKVRLKEIAEMSGEFTLSHGAQLYYEDWYYNKMRRGKPDDEKLDGFFGRKADHILRMGMILRTSQGLGFDIQEKHIDGAIRAIDGIEALMSEAFGDVGKRTEVKGNADRLFRFIHKMGAVGLSHSTALKKMYGYVNAQEFRILVTTLQESGMIHRDREPPHNYLCMCAPCKGERKPKEG